MLHESGKIEMQKIAKEIEESREKNITEVSVMIIDCVYILLLRSQVRVAKEKLQKDIEGNRELIARNYEIQQSEEQEEDLITAIMAETKKILAKERRLKEREV